MKTVGPGVWKAFSYLFWMLFFVGLLCSVLYASNRPPLEMIVVILLCYAPLTFSYIFINLKFSKNLPLEENYIVCVNGKTSFITNIRGLETIKKAVKSKRKRFAKVEEFSYTKGTWFPLCTRWMNINHIEHLESYLLDNDANRIRAYEMLEEKDGNLEKTVGTKKEEALDGI